MNFQEKTAFVAQCTKTVSAVYDHLTTLPGVPLSSLPGTAALMVVDLVNGFAKKGAMYSPRVEALVSPTAALAKRFLETGRAVLALNDCHTKDSPEFSAYPVHCLKGEWESELAEELKALSIPVIEKASTNGMQEPAVLSWLGGHPDTDTFVVTGDCTDICVQQFAIGLKTYYTRQNRPVRVLVPLDLTDTYELGLHGADFTGAAALYNMELNGVELCAVIADETPKEERP